MDRSGLLRSLYSRDYIRTYTRNEMDMCIQVEICRYKWFVEEFVQ